MVARGQASSDISLLGPAAKAVCGDPYTGDGAGGPYTDLCSTGSEAESTCGPSEQVF